MYKFVDTIQQGISAKSLPAEAMQINGKYIENEIEGYRTLSVTGRELLGSEIKELQIGYSDGAEYQDKRNLSRSITVTYQLLADTPYCFRDKFNKLCLLLDLAQSTLLFADEPDKYFIGTKSDVGEVDDGLLNVVSDFTIYCTDPYKYSFVAKTFSASMGAGVMTATIVNNGSKSVPIDYTIKHNHENGFIGIVSEHGTIQLGYKNEVDKEQRTKSQVLLDYRTPSAFDAMATGQGILGFDYGKTGSWTTVVANGRQWLAINGIGSGSSWHGASKMVTLPNDFSGVSGSTEFYVQGKIWFETGVTNQTGMMAMSIGDENGRHLAGIRVAKYDLGQNLAVAKFDIQGVERQYVSFIPAWNGCTNADTGHIYIQKIGDMFYFYFGGGKYPIREPAAKTKKAKTLTIFSGQHGTVPASMLVTRMYWDYVFFRKENVNYWVDIPNRYNGNSTIFINGSSTDVFVDGIIRCEDEIVGSNYFHAPPGNTNVQFYYSDFANPPPTITAKIREAYL